MFIILPVLADVSYLYSESLAEISTVGFKIPQICYLIFQRTSI